MSIRADVTVTGAVQAAKKLASYRTRLEANLRPHVMSALTEGATIAAQLAPVKTGALSESIGITHVASDGLSGSYGPDPMDVKAIVQEKGSGPYTIYPKTAKALRFVVGGKTVFAKKVNHPGVPAVGYMARSKQHAADELARGVRAAIADTNAGL